MGVVILREVPAERDEAAHCRELVASRDELLGAADVGLLAAGSDQLEVAARARQPAVRVEVRHPVGETNQGCAVLIDLGHVS